MISATGASLAMMRQVRIPQRDGTAGPPATKPGRTARKIAAAGLATGAGLTALGTYGLGRPFSASALECLKATFSTRGVFTREGLVVFATLSAIAMAVYGVLAILGMRGRKTT